MCLYFSKLSNNFTYSNARPHQPYLKTLHASVKNGQVHPSSEKSRPKLLLRPTIFKPDHPNCPKSNPGQSFSHTFKNNINLNQKQFTQFTPMEKQTAEVKRISEIQTPDIISDPSQDLPFLPRPHFPILSIEEEFPVLSI